MKIKATLLKKDVGSDTDNYVVIHSIDKEAWRLSDFLRKILDDDFPGVVDRDRLASETVGKCTVKLPILQDTPIRIINMLIDIFNNKNISTLDAIYQSVSKVSQPPSKKTVEKPPLMPRRSEPISNFKKEWKFLGKRHIVVTFDEKGFSDVPGPTLTLALDKSLPKHYASDKAEFEKKFNNYINYSKKSLYSSDAERDYFYCYPLVDGYNQKELFALLEKVKNNQSLKKVTFNDVITEESVPSNKKDIKKIDVNQAELEKVLTLFREWKYKQDAIVEALSRNLDILENSIPNGMKHQEGENKLTSVVKSILRLNDLHLKLQESIEMTRENLTDDALKNATEGVNSFMDGIKSAKDDLDNLQQGLPIVRTIQLYLRWTCEMLGKLCTVFINFLMKKDPEQKAEAKKESMLAHFNKLKTAVECKEDVPSQQLPNGSGPGVDI